VVSKQKIYLPPCSPASPMGRYSAGAVLRLSRRVLVVHGRNILKISTTTRVSFSDEDE